MVEIHVARNDDSDAETTTDARDEARTVRGETR